MTERRGIQSVETATEILSAIAANRAPMLLKDLAAAVSMTPGKVYPYLVSFVKTGLLVQQPETSVYDLGPTALHLGLASFQRHEPLKIAMRAITLLTAQSGHTASVAVWGNQGPTVTYIEESGYPLHVYLRPGTVMSLLKTATGLIFSAFMPPRTIAPLLKTESLRFGGEAGLAEQCSWSNLEDMLSKIRKEGLSYAIGLTVPGINAISAPVFDHSGMICLAVTLMGPSGRFDPTTDSQLAEALLVCANRISKELGYDSRWIQSEAR